MARLYIVFENLSIINFQSLAPFCDIICNIFRNTVHFALVANDAVIISFLPCERWLLYAGETGDGLFESTNYCCQSVLFICNFLHCFVFSICRDAPWHVSTI